jgi:hypothetical protein
MRCDHMQRPAEKVKQGFFWSLLRVMAGLVPAIHVLLSRSEEDVDARNKCGHDGLNERVV